MPKKENNNINKKEASLCLPERKVKNKSNRLEKRPKNAIKPKRKELLPQTPKKKRKRGIDTVVSRYLSVSVISS